MTPETLASKVSAAIKENEKIIIELRREAQNKYPRNKPEQVNKQGDGQRKDLNVSNDNSKHLFVGATKQIGVNEHDDYLA